jgi:hypothetical protein
VAVLKLRTIHFGHRFGVADQTLSRGFHGSSFASAGRTQKKKIAYGSAGMSHTRKKRLIDIDDLRDSFVLTHQLRLKVTIQLLSIAPGSTRIERLISPYHLYLSPFSPPQQVNRLLKLIFY